MSRTYRRKSIPNKKMYIIPENSHWRDDYSDDIPYETYVKRARAVYRSDNNRLMFGFRANVPWMFRNMYQERPFRMKTKQQMQEAARLDTWDNLSIVQERRDTWVYY